MTGFIVTQTESFALALVSAGVVLALGILPYVVVMGKIEPVPEPVA
jgi:ACS family D-galactonate transporter-like MFS transporter